MASVGRVRFFAGQGDDTNRLPLFDDAGVPPPTPQARDAGGNASASPQTLPQDGMGARQIQNPRDPRDNGSFTPPRLLKRVEAEYTDAARNARVRGAVVLRIVVGVDGAVKDAKVATSLGYSLDEKAIEAVKRWKFEAARRNGQPAEAGLTVEIGFQTF